MVIEEVTTKTQAKEFLEVPVKIYKPDKNWVRPLDGEINNIFSAQDNVLFSHGEACRWILRSGVKTVGRVAAFLSQNKIKGLEQINGGMGFFECIPNQEAAFMLFDQCKDWLVSKGVKAMDGPINFGENNNYWGLLTQGFTQPSYGMNYNPRYYQKFFEDYGFKKLYEQYTNHFDINKPLPERFRKIVERVSSKPGYRFDHIHMDRLDKYVEDIVTIYNKAWKFKDDFKEIEPEYIRNQFQQMKAIVDERMIWFVYANNEPAGFFIAIPDVNQIIKRLNGKLGLWEKLKFLYLKKTHVIDRVRVIIMGIIPEYQGKGLESGLIVRAFDEVKSMGRYREGELSWVGSFNPAMMAIHKASGATLGKTHITYRREFELNLEPLKPVGQPELAEQEF